MTYVESDNDIVNFTERNKIRKWTLGEEKKERKE